ncbi:glycoside hydrolase family 127 protein [Paludisphaera borealis]|nr:beta-L-arabinofuranosidase domain-containing protein [Paludisphaera borealis]
MKPATRSLLSGLMVLWLATSARSAPIEPVPFRVPAKLADVAQVVSPARIQLDGWLGARVKANATKRLLNVDVEPLLAGYRKKPGSHPWIGEHIGKWLHAATLAWVNNGDPALKDKLDKVVAELVACQEPDGYLGTYVPEKRFGLYQEADWDVWSHKYNLIGLLTYHQYTGSQPALDACRRMANLLASTFPAKRSILAAGTQVGMASTSVLEPIVLLYRFTGEARYLDFARYIVKSWDEPNGPKVLASLAAGKGVNETGNGKAYEMLSNLVGLCELARATGDRSYLDPVIHAWEDVVANRLYLTGSASDGEHFHADHVLPNRVSAHVGETCVTTTWIQLSLQLLRLTGENRYGDELDRAFYNHLTAAQHPDGDDWCYYTALEGRKPYDAGITCCHSSGPRGMALAVQSAYLETRWEDYDAVLVNTLETSRATLTRDGQEIVVEQKSGFPREGRSTLAVRSAKPARLAIRIRKPSWSSRLTVSSKGSSASLNILPDGSVVVVSDAWQPDTVTDIHFELNSRLVPGGISNPGRAAMTWGPFVLAYDEARNPGGVPARTVGLVENERLELLPGPNLAFRGPAVGRDSGDPRPAVFVPFADAGSTGEVYRVWLRAPGVALAKNESLLADAEESASRDGNVGGAINDGDPENFVVTFNGRKATEDWYALSLREPATIARVVYRHGQSFHDGGWFDASHGKPRVQVRREKDGPWETVGELADYPAATSAKAPDLKPGQAFELRMKEPVTARAIRIIGTPASGDNPDQAFSSCGEIEAFGK